MNLFETVLGSFSCGYNCQLSTTCKKKSKCLFLIETSQCVHTIHITDSDVDAKYLIEFADFIKKNPVYLSILSGFFIFRSVQFLSCENPDVSGNDIFL